MEGFKETHVCKYHFVNKNGIVRSIDKMVKNGNGARVVRGKTKTQTLSSNGYMMVYINESVGKVTVHSLIARAFVKGYKKSLQVNHKNGNKLKNKSSNLEWVTSRENTIHAVKNGMIKSGYSRLKGVVGEQHGMAKLTNENVVLIFNEVAGGSKQTDVAEKYNVTQATVWRIANRKAWVKATANLLNIKYNKNGRLFNNEQIASIKKLREKGISFANIAREFNCSKKTIMNSVSYA